MLFPIWDSIVHPLLFACTSFPCQLSQLHCLLVSFCNTFGFHVAKMKLTSRQSTYQNGSKHRHQAAVSRRSRSLSPPSPPEILQLPHLSQLLPRHSLKASPQISQSTMGPSNDLFPPSGLNRLPHPPTMPSLIPPLPPAWEGREEMKIWLNAKIEEDRRKQEEERSYQASVVLEQRRIEHAVIADSLRAGVPPNLIPSIFHGIYTTGADLKLAAELQRQWSTPEKPALTTMPPQQKYTAPVQPAKAAQNAFQKSPQESHQKSPSESRPTAMLFVPEMSQHQSSVKFQRYRSKPRPERRRPRRQLNSKRVELADNNISELDLNSDPFHVLKGPTHQIHDPPFSPGSSRMWTSKRQSRPRLPLQYHHWSPREMVRPHSRSQPHMVTVDSVGALNALQPRAKQPISPAPKRKDERPHERAPPPQFYLNQTDSSTKQKSNGGSFFNQNQQQSDISSSNESHSYDADCSEQTQEPSPVSMERPSVIPSPEIPKQVVLPRGSADSDDASESVQDAAGDLIVCHCDP